VGGQSPKLARLFAFMTVLVLAAVTFAWWGVLVWLVWRVIFGTARGANAAVMACEVSRPTRTTFLRKKPNFALFKSPLPSRLPRRRVLRRLFPN
jgi:hypothetical protein